jgi:hypothetical protein
MSNRRSLSDELIDLATEYAEVDIDQLIDNEILRELPGVKNNPGLIRGVRSARDIVFIRKIKKFINTIDQLSDEEREQFARRFEDNSKARARLTDALLLILDQLDNMEKAELFARAFSAFVRGEINFYIFRRYGEIIKAANVTHLRNLYQSIQANDSLVNNSLSDQVLPLSSLGLVELSEPPPPHDIPAKDGTITYYITTAFGRRFVEIISDDDGSRLLLRAKFCLQPFDSASQTIPSHIMKDYLF